MAGVGVLRIGLTTSMKFAAVNLFSKSFFYYLSTSSSRLSTNFPSLLAKVCRCKTSYCLIISGCQPSKNAFVEGRQIGKAAPGTSRFARKLTTGALAASHHLSILTFPRRPLAFSIFIYSMPVFRWRREGKRPSDWY